MKRGNTYIYDLTFEDKHSEEDRECTNDLKRAKIDYYDTLTDINLIFLEVLEKMSTEEIKQVLMCKNIVDRLQR